MTAGVQSRPILQPALPDAVTALLVPHRLPGTRPCAPDSWIERDAAFAGQMALRDQLIADRPDAVHALTEPAQPATDELLRAAIAVLQTRDGYGVGAETVRRPDGVVVPMDRTAPLLTLGRIVQEDLCILQSGPDGHVLTAAILCFPASWSLDEKLGRPLSGVHAPVAEYDHGLARRVQRMFDAIRPGQPLERANLLGYDDPALFQPRREASRRDRPGSAPPYLRSERQCLLRMPATGAVVFTIHSYVLRRADAPAALHGTA